MTTTDPDGLLPFCGDPSPYVGDSCQLPLGHDGPHRDHPHSWHGWHDDQDPMSQPNRRHEANERKARDGRAAVR
jgi:hypothetical protein